MKRGSNLLVVTAAVVSLGWVLAAAAGFAVWRAALRERAAELMSTRTILVARLLAACGEKTGFPCLLAPETGSESLGSGALQTRVIPDSLRLLPRGTLPDERYLAREGARFLVAESFIGDGRTLQLRRPLDSIVPPQHTLFAAAGVVLAGALLPFLLLAGLLRRERSRTVFLLEVARAADEGRPVPETPPGVSGEEASLVASLGSDLRRRRILSKWEERRLTRLLDALAEGVLLLDGRMRVLACNTSAAEALEMRQAKAAIRGRPIVSLTPDLGFLDDLRKAVARPGNPGFDVHREARVFTARVWPVPADSENGGWLVSLRDVTSQRRAEQLQSRLVSDASHEFKTPLTSIRGWTETLLEDEEDDFRRRALERVAQGTRHLEEVVRDLLDLGRIAETSSQARHPVSLDSVCAEALSTLEGEAARKEIRVVLHADPAAVVVGFRGQLVRAAINLLSNAIRYSPVGSTVAVSILPRPDGWWSLEVADHGPGIHADALPHLFERFFRADHGRSRDLGGTGLGLAIVQDTARVHEGRAEVDSEPGRGSAFRLVLPGLPPEPHTLADAPSRQDPANT